MIVDGAVPNSPYGLCGRKATLNLKLSLWCKGQLLRYTQPVQLQLTRSSTMSLSHGSASREAVERGGRFQCW